MFERIFNKSGRLLKIFARVQCFFSFVIAIIVFGAIFNVLGQISVFAAVVLGVAIAVIVWFVLMFSAWMLYAFADLVEYTKATHKEVSELSAGLAKYTKAMNDVMNSMNKDLFFIARHYYAEEEKVKEEPTSEENAKNNDNEEN